MFQNHYLIIKKEMLTPIMCRLVISCDEVAQAASAGQFVHIKADGFFLRRPISISEIDKTAGTISIVFEQRGEGTKKMLELQESDLIDMLAPLGNGFNTEGIKKALIVGGGIGVFPLLQVAKDCENSTVVLGFRNREAVVLEDDFRKYTNDLTICTDDASYGTGGFVTAPFEKAISTGGYDMVCACGPEIMLERVIALAHQFGVRCLISKEERMACGTGACLVCACKAVKDGEETMARVCKDGPVFEV